MTSRTQAVQLAQVRHKVSEASNRAQVAVARALAATSADEYERELAKSLRAVSDHDAWSRVLGALEGLPVQ